MRWVHFCLIYIATSLQGGEIPLKKNSCPIIYIENHLSSITNLESFLNKSLELENCLLHRYQLDQDHALIILSYFETLLNEEKYHSIIDDFIEESEKLNIDFTTLPSQEISLYDGTLKASKWHTLLFESPHIRILQGIVNCGECDPFHLHQWERLMVVIQGAVFKTEFSDGTFDIEDCSMGVYYLEPETAPAAYTNLSNTPFESLIFEIKK